MFAALCLAALLSSSQQTVIVRGLVIDAKTTGPVPDAQVALVELSRSVRTGPDGRFELKDVAPGTYTLTVSTIGFIFVRRQIDVHGDTIDFTIPLSEGTGTYQETVMVAADTSQPSSLGVSSQMDLGSAALADLRGVATDDPMRAMQALPGVAAGDDFLAEFSVRGSAYRHVGVVIDNTSTPLLLHSVRGTDNTGSIAMINTDIVSHGSLLAGPHPLRQGDWIGATLEFDVREGTRDRLALRAAVSGTSASAIVEGPVGPGKRGSWLFSARKSYLDWLIRKLDPETDSTIGFVDGTAKLVYDVTPRQQFQFLVLGGRTNYQELDAGGANSLRDATANTGLLSAAWRSTGARWALTERVSFVGSDFNNRGRLTQELARGYTQSIIARVDFTASLSRHWTLDAGARHERYRLNQILRDYTTVGDGPGIRLRSSRETSEVTTLLAGWAQVSRRTDTAGITAGLRVASRTLATGSGVSPWLLGERRFGRTTIRGGLGSSVQFYDPTLVLAGPEPIRPERAFAADLGLVQQLNPTTSLRVTGFLRNESDVVRRVGEDRLDPVRNVRIPATTFPVYRGSIDGTSRGVDVVLMRRATAALTGWVGYTYSHTKHDDTVSGELFDADQDQRHTLNVFALQRLSYRMTVGAKLRVGSNFPLVGYFEQEGDQLFLASERNLVRLPVYARLDLRVNRTFTFSRARLTLFVELMNALGRENIGQADGSVRPNFEAVGYGEKLIPFVPSAGFLIEF